MNNLKDAFLGPRLRILLENPDAYTTTTILKTPIVIINYWPVGLENREELLTSPTVTSMGILRLDELLTILDVFRNMTSSTHAKDTVTAVVESLRWTGPPVACMFGKWLGMFTTLAQLVSEAPTFDVELDPRHTDGTI